MKFQLRGLWKMVLALICVLFLNTAVHAQRYEFSQNGFAGKAFLPDGSTKSFANGKISGFFEGKDQSNQQGKASKDGIILGGFIGGNEVTKFSLNFSGNPFFDSLHSIAWLGDEDGNALWYDTRSNNLKLNLNVEHDFDAFASAITGNNYNYLLAGTHITLSGGKQKGQVSLYSIYAEGYTKSGDEIIGDPGLTVTLSSSEPVTVSQTPLPGALGLFALGWLGIAALKRKKTV